MPAGQSGDRARSGRCFSNSDASDGKERAFSKLMDTAERIVEFWLDSSRLCVLCTVDHTLELRLYNKNKLVGLEPCRNGEEALDIVKRWRECPPRWPPF